MKKNYKTLQETADALNCTYHDIYTRTTTNPKYMKKINNVYHIDFDLFCADIKKAQDIKRSCQDKYYKIVEVFNDNDRALARDINRVLNGDANNLTGLYKFLDAGLFTESKIVSTRIPKNLQKFADYIEVVENTIT